MVTVLLYGHLAKQFGKRHCFDIATPAEAVRALSANFKTFKQAIIQDGQAAYRVLAGNEDRADTQDLHLPLGKLKTVKIVPVVSGANGLGRVLLGAALIGASFFLPTAPIVASISVSSIASSIGFSLLLGGVAQMLFSPPKVKTTERPENQPSYAFNGAVNTVGQGNPVPYFFGGPMRIGSQVISAGLAAENL